MDTRIPVTLLTGFLGAGKTTLLNRLLEQPGLADSAVLINEFGEIGVDHWLVEKVDEQVVVLEGGCLCCAMRGDLVQALQDLFMRGLQRRSPPLRRVLIETTGLADPGPLVQTLRQTAFLAERFRLEQTVTVVDALDAPTQLAAHPEAARQVALADRLVLSKTDLIAPNAEEALQQRLRRINPGAPFSRADEIVADEFLAPRDEWRPWLSPAPQGFSLLPQDAPHDARVRAFSLHLPAAPSWPMFSAALDMLLNLHGERILRIKGLVEVAGESAPRVVQAVGHRRYPAAVLPAWPEGVRESRLVVIARDLDDDALTSVFARRGLLPSSEPAVIESRVLADLARIMEDGTQLALYHRPPNPAISTYLEQAAPHLRQQRVSVTPGREEIPLQLPDLAGRAALLEDLNYWVELYAVLMDCAQVGVRLEVIERAMCPRFHVDSVGIRLLCTYRGPGTEWLEDTGADRSRLGRGAEGLADELSGLIRDPAAVRVIPPFSVALLKGKLWQNQANPGLIHRSPAVPSEQQPRVLLALDALY